MSYIKCSYASKDIKVRKIDYAFVSGYEFFLRSSLNCTAITNSSDIVFTSYTSSIAVVTSSLKMGKSSFVTKFISMKISIKLDATLHQLN